MPSPLATLRQQAPRLSPVRFLAYHPGCWIQYYDDTPAKDPAKALSAPSFHPAVARFKQRDRCAVCFSLQAFRGARTKEGIVRFQNLGVDVDLVAAGERQTLPPAEIDGRKDSYLRQRLLPFALRPHWLIETRHGFHVVFRTRPLTSASGIAAAEAVNRVLVRLLGGDESATLLTQVLRVPGTQQYKDPRRPFLCRLLLENGSTLAPYDLDVVRSVLHAWDVFHEPGAKKAAGSGRKFQTPDPPVRRWEGKLAGVPEGHRNAAAASVVGSILCRLPEPLWDVAGWGGLKEWNLRNGVPLPERELRTVFASIARRERAKQHRLPAQRTPEQSVPPAAKGALRRATTDVAAANTIPSPSPLHHAES